MSEDPLAFRVLNEIAIVEQLARTRLERALPGGLTVPQFAVLNHFVRLGGERSPARLAAAFQVTAPTMTSTLQRLVRGGYVTIRPDPRDGRGKLVAITAEGVAARQAGIEAILPVLTQLERAIPELALLLPGLVRVHAFMDATREVEPTTPTDLAPGLPSG